MTDRRWIDWTAIDARMARAERHITDLQIAIEDFGKRPPYRHERVVTDSGSVVERVDSIQPAPVGLAMIASDAIHQARAALDNAIGAMRPGGPTGSSAFPVYATREDFDQKAPSAIAGIPDWAAELIVRMQPFSGVPFPFGGGNLRDLHDAARFDRHRAPAVQVALLQPDYVEGRVVQFRGDWATWVEVEYRPGEVQRVHFKVEVQLADGPYAGIELVGGVTMLARVAQTVIGQLQLAERRAR